MVASDSSAAGRRAFMDFYRKGLELTNAAYRAGVPVMLGTDAGDSFVFPGASVHDELEELVKAGLSAAEALKAATLTGVEYLGRTADLGTLESGKLADAVLLDQNPLQNIANVRRIHGVLLNGRYYDRARLDQMLAEVEATANRQ
jgi:imidazolonepropionase-like amidohydrolase